MKKMDIFLNNFFPTVSSELKPLFRRHFYHSKFFKVRRLWGEMVKFDVYFQDQKDYVVLQVDRLGGPFKRRKNPSAWSKEEIAVRKFFYEKFSKVSFSLDGMDKDAPQAKYLQNAIRGDRLRFDGKHYHVYALKNPPAVSSLEFDGFCSQNNVSVSGEGIDGRVSDIVAKYAANGLN